MSEQRWICIWLDDQSNRSKDSLDAENDLRDLVNSFRYYNNLTRCIDSILNIESAKIIFITVDTLAEQIVPIIHSSKQIHSIYIFHSIEKSWTKDYQKVQGFFNNQKLICQKIKESFTQPKSRPPGISFISSNDIDSNDINRQDPSFMYFQLLKEIILNDHRDEIEAETKKDMLNYCRQIYARSTDTLEILNEFEQNFIPELSVYWYTRECFLYQILNTALWTPQPDVLYKLRYFLRHLHQQILSQAALQRNDRTSVTVYRGQNMSEEEIKKLKANKGGFLSFNNFLSTSLRRNVALNFLWGIETGVLFEMFIDPTIQKFPFASIEHLSFNQGQRGESELLFSAGTVFRIVEINKKPDYYHVQLILSNDIDEQLAKYTKRTREQTQSSHSFLSLVKLMHELSLFNSVERFAEMLKDESSLAEDPAILGSVHHAFGMIYLSRGQPKDALGSFQKSLSIYLTVLPADHPKLSPTYNNIGSVHLAQSNYETALTFQKLALDCESNSESPDTSAIIAYTNNLGSIYNQQGKYNDALIYHQRALELQKRYRGENDLSLTNTYNAISTVYYKLEEYEQATFYQEKAVALQRNRSESDPETSANCFLTSGNVCHSQGQYTEALEHFNRALQIQQQYFLPNNPSFATTYNFIARAYYKQDRFEEALVYYKKALEIEQVSLSNDHPSIVTSHSNICTAYVGLSRWSDALEYGLKAFELLKKSSKTDINTHAKLMQYIGHIYHQQNEYETALRYYQEALDLSFNYLSEDDASLVVLYYRTANAYNELKRYEEALSFYQKTLNVELKILPDNAKTIAATYTNISTVYFHLKQFDNALIAAKDGLDQLLKTLPKNHPEVVQQQVLFDALQMSHMLQDINQ